MIFFKYVEFNMWVTVKKIELDRIDGSGDMAKKVDTKIIGHANILRNMRDREFDPKAKL